MRFAIPFSYKFRYLNDTDNELQLNINYKPRVKQLSQFVQLFHEYRINLVFYDDFDVQTDLRILEVLKKYYPEVKIVLCLPKYSAEIEKIMNQHELLHYYNTYISDLDAFNGFLSLNVTDIWITENLMFNI